MHWLNIIEAPFAFFFLGTKGESKLKSHWDYIDEIKVWPANNDIYEEACAAKAKYEIQIRKKFGLGFFLSFIPGTNSFKTRIDYLKHVLACDEDSLSTLSKDGEKDLVKSVLISSIATPLSFLGKFIKAWACILGPVKENIVSKRGWLNGPDLMRETFVFFPSEETADEWLSDRPEWFLEVFIVLYFCANPFKLFSIIFTVVHHMVDYFIENLVPERSWASIIFKSISAAFFIPSNLFSGTLSAVVASFWEVVGFLTLEPAKFIYASIKQTIQHWGEDWNPEILVTDTLTLQAVKVLRKMDKAIENDRSLIRSEGPDAVKHVKEIEKLSYHQIYTQMTKAETHQTRYLTVSKDVVYNGQTRKLPVILAATPEKGTEFRAYKQKVTENANSFREYCSTVFPRPSDRALNMHPDLFIRTICEELQPPGHSTKSALNT